MRNTLGGVAPLFATQFFKNVGSQYAGLILALAGMFLTLIPFMMFKYGHVLRQRSKLAKRVGGSRAEGEDWIEPGAFRLRNGSWELRLLYRCVGSCQGER